MHNLSIIGAGSMAESLIAGWMYSNKILGEQILVTNRGNDERLSELKNKYGIQSTRNADFLVQDDRIIILACKPKDWEEALLPYINNLNASTPVISVMAGVTIHNIESFIPAGVPVVRTMPNTSATVCASMTTLCFGNSVSNDIKHTIQSLFSIVGETAIVIEDQMDAMTALIGTGPAYIYYLMESIEKAAGEMNIDYPLAKKLVAQTLYGASKRVQEGHSTPNELYKQIMSPGGTTEAGFNVLHSQDVQNSIISCILAAWQRSQQLGQSNTKQPLQSSYARKGDSSGL
ncbi:pyrroline-5-carboxylate reductase [Evansella halocellulosilytica]|uniref:pyrroline-5-carboxylate reductase n=1 Tax=Evansella halocellulosilytica TaxID=2011013 RepID=UPI000BB6CA2D|nr:pyrroline-5-carboxylate reductase [Evansella halocellulosilytica]